MVMFAHYDLLMVQNKHAAAIATLDSINQLFPAHALADDILFARAKMSAKKHDYTQAAEYLQSIFIKHPDSLYTVESRKQYRKLRGDSIN